MGHNPSLHHCHDDKIPFIFIGREYYLGHVLSCHKASAERFTSYNDCFYEIYLGIILPLWVHYYHQERKNELIVIGYISTFIIGYIRRNDLLLR